MRIVRTLQVNGCRAPFETTTGTQPSGCRGVSIAPCCSVNAAFLFAEPPSSLLKKPPGEGTGPTKRADFRRNLVGRVPSRGEQDVSQQAARLVVVLDASLVAFKVDLSGQSGSSSYAVRSLYWNK